MPRTAADNQRLKDERREEILRAALAVFARKGLAAAKISDVAQAAELSHGLVYHYFESKEAIYAALVEELFARVSADLDAIAARDGSPLARIRAFVEHRLARLAAEPEMFRLVMQAFLHPDAIPSSTREVLERFAGRCLHVMSAAIREGQARGEIVAGDPESLAAALFAVMNGLAMSQLFELDVPRVVPGVEVILGLLVPANPVTH
jgi:AcrR family transcriptional regulator